MQARAVQSVEGDVPHIAKRLRAVDLKEIAIISGRDPLEALQDGYERSDDPRTILAPNVEPVAMFGVVPFTPGVGGVWLLGTDRFTEIETIKPFMRWCRPWVDDMQSRHPILFNHIWRGNEVSQRWLRWCGFEFFPTDNPEILRFERHLCVNQRP